MTLPGALGELLRGPAHHRRRRDQRHGRDEEDPWRGIGDVDDHRRRDQRREQIGPAVGPRTSFPAWRRDVASGMRAAKQLLGEQVGALLQRGRARGLREALLVGLDPRGARGGRRPARLGQGAAGPEAAPERVAELARIDADAWKRSLSGCALAGALNVSGLLTSAKLSWKSIESESGAPGRARWRLQLEGGSGSGGAACRLSPELTSMSPDWTTLSSWSSCWVLTLPTALPARWAMVFRSETSFEVST